MPRIPAALRSTHPKQARDGNAPLRSLHRPTRAAASMLFCAAMLARGAGLVRGPVIGRIDDSTAAVVWWTDEACDTRLDGLYPGGEPFSVRRPERLTKHVVPLPAPPPGGGDRYQPYPDP